MPQHFIFRIGDGTHFISSSSKYIWGINTNSKAPFGKWFKSNAEEGDLLWFITGKSKGHIVAVATFTGTKERILGPLVELTYTNSELGWTKTKGDWNTEVHYKDLYNLTQCNLFSEIRCTSTIMLYSEKCKVNLPTEYPHIVRYSKVSNSMLVPS